MVKSSTDCEIVAGIDLFPAEPGVPFPTYTNLNDCDMAADVIIDFSIAHAVPAVLDYAIKTGIPLVLCTTGLSDETLKLVEAASQKVAILRSANMSVGINLIASLMEKVVAALSDSNFDIEIIEKHHNQKIDAPSGTALLLADAINAAADGQYDYTYDRSKKREKRSEKELGIHAIRGGSIVGEHTIIFAGKDETIEITHSATSKEVFAVGAVKAARFLAGKQPKLYDMNDVMQGE
ncbi:MAG: 4-hydroxy-tetrahydrodipicolinate reductase [Clostridiales bacterium]|nr:4-hydroxy-tetrahydrodipicolinate reductase [Clostridiales bacterium]